MSNHHQTLPFYYTALSFLLPLVQLMITLPAVPAVLILSPTRELCQQIEEQAKILMKGRERGRGREGEREGGRERGREGGREGE